MRRSAVAVAAALASCLLQAGAAGAATTKPLAVHATFTPGAAEFGDVVIARIVVTLNTRSVRPSSLRVVYGVAPLTQLGGTIERRVTRDGLHLVTYELRAACLADSCLAASTRRIVAPAAVRAVVAGTNGTRFRTTAAWVPLTVSSRVASADLSAASPPFRADATTPAPTYRVRPSLLTALLEGVAAILAACGVGLAASALLRARRPRSAEHPDELTRALLLARAARGRSEADRRTAAGYLARLLARRGAGMAHTADDLAWSRPAPTPDSLTQLVEGVERERPA